MQTYVEQEKELPVYEERKQHVLKRIENMEKEMEKLMDRKFVLSSQLTGMDTMIEKLKETFSGEMMEETDRRIRSSNEAIGELQIQKGVLLERLENIDTMRGEISIEIEKDKEKDNKYICPEVNSGQPQPKVEIEPVAENRTKVEIEPSCSKTELKVEIEPAQADVFIKLPLINGDDFLVTKGYVKELKELYPAVDVEQALRNMRGWLDANPRNRKTPRGIKRFITGWISREQDKAPRVLTVLANPSPSSPGSPPGVRSGNLRRNWNMYYSGGGGNGIFGIQSGMHYAGYLEHGTSKMAARPYVEKVKETALPEILEIFSEIGG